MSALVSRRATPAARITQWLAAPALALLLIAACTDSGPVTAPSPSAPVAIRPPANANGLPNPIVAIQLSAIDRHTCALKNDYSIACWGHGPESPPSSASYVFVAAGEWQNCAIRGDQTLYCWDSEGPGSVIPGTFTQVASDWDHACAIRTDGTVACWGNDEFGKSTPPPGTFTSIDVGFDHSCGIRSDGTLACWGNSAAWAITIPGEEPLLQWPGTFTQVSAGSTQTCAIHTNGSLVCEGDNYAFANAPVGDFVHVSAGVNDVCVVRSTFALWCWGSNFDGQSPAPPGTYTQVAAAREHVCAIDFNGNVKCWGSNSQGQLDVPYELGDPVATTTSLTSSPDPSTFGQKVTFTATVTVTEDDAPAPSGAVTFILAGTCAAPTTTLAANVAVNASGQAKLETTTLAIGVPTVTACYTGADGLLPSEWSKSHQVNQGTTATSISVSPATTQYSDRVQLTASVSPAQVNGSAVTGTIQFSINGTAAASVSLGAGATATALVPVSLAQGAYAVTAAFTSSNTNFAGSTSGTANVTVTREDALVVYDGNNAAALPVSSAGGALNTGALSLRVGVKEKEPDTVVEPGTAANGLVANAGLTVSLLPVGPGTTHTLVCTPTGVIGVGYAAIRNFTCTNSAPIAVNAYEVQANVTGNHYAGAYSDVFTVYDPSLGSAAGGGTFLLNGDRTRFGINVKYKKNGSGAKGSIIVVRQHPDGTTSSFTSNALSSTVALGEDPSVPMGWAAITGKSTYTTWDAAANGYVTVGGQSFTLYVEDRGDPGIGNDRIWIGGPGLLALPGTPSSARTNAVLLTGGNVLVPK